MKRLLAKMICQKGVVLRIQPLFMKKTFIFPMLILNALPESAKIFSKKVFEKFGG